MKLLLTLLLAVSAPFAVAQQNTNQNTNKNTEDSSEKSYIDEEDHRRFWQASFPGGEFVVALDRISSISKHEYVLDGNLLVTEVSIDTNGNALTRIYQITPVAERSNLATAQKMVERGTELLDQVGQRTGNDFQSMVQKKYPLTTHSKSIEYRVADIGTLNAIFSSINKAWQSGKGRKFRMKKK